MRSEINRGIRTAISATAKSFSGARKPDNTGLWTNFRSKTFAGHPQVSDKNQLIFGKIGEIRVRSTSQLIRIWEQQKRNYSMNHQEIKHQEIEGPTVERDMSEVAKESRLVTESMMKSMYDVSKSVAGLAVFQLAVGGYLCSGSGLGNDVLSMGVSAVAFGFPISMALMMRQSLKGMQFFDRMEKAGRLQLLTSSMQISKQIRLFFLRLRVVAYTSLGGLFLSLVYSLLAPVISST
ncbi:uncharacterized protein LOC141638543 [Silene latifolia]|uniref:uncharacterized protein LOC141638543 n=1 Tax=Silene latifolia TaxID=37657 RepID=UPI003D77258B